MATVITIWAYCSTCFIRTEQFFVRDEGVFEVYQCSSCHREHRYAVRYMDYSQDEVE